MTSFMKIFHIFCLLVKDPTFNFSNALHVPVTAFYTYEF